MDSHFENFEQCITSGKNKYTWTQAKTELERLKKDGIPPDSGFHLEAYFCKKCRSWHIGSQANRTKGLRNKYRPYDPPTD